MGYIRVSTLDQAVEGVSLEAQRRKIEAWAELHGFTLLAVHEDAGISGKSADNRPGLQQALKDACANRAALVVLSLSRLARSTTYQAGTHDLVALRRSFRANPARLIRSEFL